MGLLPPVSALGLEFLDWALALLGQAHLDFLLVRRPGTVKKTYSISLLGKQRIV